jgi:N-dimethylarginine dimethylaminohydrolase
MTPFGTCDEYSRLRSVIMCPPVHFEIKTPINAVQAKWHGLGRGPDPVEGLRQYTAVKDALIKKGVDVWEIPPSKDFSYQVFTRDAGVVAETGAIVGRFKFKARMGEERELVKMLEREALPVAYECSAPGIFEGGDFVFLNNACAYVGIGDRTDADAFGQLKTRMPDLELHPVDLPEGYLHLDVVLNIVSADTALAFVDALPAPILEHLEASGVHIISVPASEQETMGTNALSIGENTLITASCNTSTNEKLRRQGFAAIEIEMSEIIKGGGGPRCMTLPVWRG